MTVFVYILYCPTTKKSYVGQTNNLILRYHEHKSGLGKWSRNLKNPTVVYWEEHQTRSLAVRKERYFKSGIGFEERKRLIKAFLDSSVG